MSGKSKRELKQEYREQQRARLREGMSLTPTQLATLLNYLDERLCDEECDHTPRLTAVFLLEQNMSVQLVLDWLRDQGGACDCEVLANLEDVVEELDG